MLDSRTGKLKAQWAADVDRIGNHYEFNDDQRTKAAAELKHSEEFADIWFGDKDKTEKREKYFHELAGVQKVEHDPRGTVIRARARRRQAEGPGRGPQDA